jgi:hypothetical protein
VKLFRLEASELEFVTFDETPRFLAAVRAEWKAFVIVG